MCLRHRGQNFDISRRSGSFFRFFVVEYVRERQVWHASVMIGRLSFVISAYSKISVTAAYCAPTSYSPWPCLLTSEPTSGIEPETSSLPRTCSTN